MALLVQINPVGMVSTDEGYISSISIRNAGGTVVYAVDGNNQIGAGTALGAAAATRIVQEDTHGFKIVTGS